MELLTFALGIFSTIMILSYYRMARKLKAVNYGFLQLYKDYVAIQDVIISERASGALETDQDIHKENFIKFLSDSRDWAFGYIENVQAGIKKFIDEVGPQIEYYNKYGVVVDGMIPPHDFALKKISKEVDELKKFLPEESNDRR